jgi:hypothetical protein
MQADDIFVLALLTVFFGSVVVLSIRSRRNRSDTP